MTQDNEFKMKVSEWRGYVLRALEDVDKTLVDLGTDIKETNQKIDLLNRRIVGLQIKVAGIGGIAGIGAGIVAYLVTKALEGF